MENNKWWYENYPRLIFISSNDSCLPLDDSPVIIPTKKGLIASYDSVHSSYTA